MQTFLTHLNMCGIIQHVSCLGTPEQNGVAERKHRHIVETGLTMLFHARLPKNLWIEAFMTTVCLINRLPSSKLAMDTPFFKLHGVHPDYNSLKVFGCRCFPYLQDYAKNLSPSHIPTSSLGIVCFIKATGVFTHQPSKCIYLAMLSSMKEFFHTLIHGHYSLPHPLMVASPSMLNVLQDFYPLHKSTSHTHL